MRPRSLRASNSRSFVRIVRRSVAPAMVSSAALDGVVPASAESAVARIAASGRGRLRPGSRARRWRWPVHPRRPGSAWRAVWTDGTDGTRRSSRRVLWFDRRESRTTRHPRTDGRRSGRRGRRGARHPAGSRRPALRRQPSQCGTVSRAGRHVRRGLVALLGPWIARA